MANRTHKNKDKKLLDVFKLLKKYNFNIIYAKSGYKLEYIPTKQYYSYHHCTGYNKRSYSRFKKWILIVSDVII